MFHCFVSQKSALIVVFTDNKDFASNADTERSFRKTLKNIGAFRTETEGCFEFLSIFCASYDLKERLRSPLRGSHFGRRIF